MNFGDNEEKARKRLYKVMARRHLRLGQQKAVQHLQQGGFSVTEISQTLELPQYLVTDLMK